MSKNFDLSKRVLDVLVATAGLVVTSPVQAIVAAAVKLKLGSPVLFRQDRPGRNNEIFRLVKFRTMEPPSAKFVTDEERLTPLGRFLRGTSLDELPTLWNVLRGDMSLVGPRPLRVHYLPLYTPEQSRRHEVRPGITGLAQINGRNAISWEERLAYDVEYVNRRCWKLDLAILARTAGLVLSRKGVTAEGYATMRPFVGPEK